MLLAYNVWNMDTDALLRPKFRPLTLLDTSAFAINLLLHRLFLDHDDNICLEWLYEKYFKFSIDHKKCLYQGYKGEGIKLIL